MEETLIEILIGSCQVHIGSFQIGLTWRNPVSRSHVLDLAAAVRSAVRPKNQVVGDEARARF